MKNYKGGNFTWYECESHAYLKVPLSIVFAVGIHPKIDYRFSPMVEQYVYLEEDCDAPLFMDAFKNHYGEPAEYNEEFKTAEWADQLFDKNELYPFHDCWD